MKKILVVDDEPDIADLVKENLSDLAGQILTVTNGREALKVLEAERPDLIITDYAMPHLNGLEMVRFMHDKNISIPLIWLSGNSTPERMQEAYRFGVVDFYEKPIPFQKLRESVTAALAIENTNSGDKPTNFIHRRFYTEIPLAIRNETYKKLDQYCLDHGTSMSTFIEKLIENELTEKNMSDFSR